MGITSLGRHGQPCSREVKVGGATWPLGWSIAALLVAAAVILFAGIRLSRLADVLADRLGFGEALFGGVFLGASTSLSGIVVSFTAALEEHPNLAFSNAVGGIAAQTVFIAVADLFYSKANLEHAAASLSNITYGALLTLLLGLPLLAAVGPEVSVLSVHPVTPLLLLAYGYGLMVVRKAHSEPMWFPQETRETERDVPHEEAGPSNPRLWSVFALLAALTAASGWVIARAGTSIAAHTGLSETLVGALFTAISTSLPELVTSVAAVRQGSPTLAVGGIIGGNAFDVLFLAFADVAYRPGSLYHAVEHQQLFLLALSVVLTAVLEMGMLRRERRGLANIGAEGVLLLALYFGGMTFLFLQGRGG